MNVKLCVSHNYELHHNTYMYTYNRVYNIIIAYYAYPRYISLTYQHPEILLIVTKVTRFTYYCTKKANT